MSAQRSFDFPVGLYRGKPGHAKGSDTSREAAEQAREVATLQRRVYAALCQREGTVWDVMERLGLPMHRKDSIAPRFTELKNAGLIAKSGKRRPSPHGRSATVWRAIPNTESEAA